MCRLMNDDMKYMNHFQVIAEYYARSRIDAIIIEGTSIDDLELTLGDVQTYIIQFREHDPRSSRVDFTTFPSDFLSHYGFYL
jgi:hypothetical protein